MTVGRKITVLLPTFKGSSDELKHLFFILTDPCTDYECDRNEMLLLVNCSSIVPNKPYDDTCILHIGDHPFIVKDSYIYYKEMRIESLLNIQRGIEEKRFIKKEIINDELYQRILTGAFQSRKSERKYLRFLKGAISQGACLDIFNINDTTTE